MQNITLNIIGQRVLANVLKEKEDIIKMNILFFENLSDFLKNTKNNIVKSIVVTHLSNFEFLKTALASRIPRTSARIAKTVLVVLVQKSAPLD